MTSISECQLEIVLGAMAAPRNDARAMATDHIDVRYVAQLARLELNEEEITTFQHQLEDILGYVASLMKFDVEGIEPIAHPTPVFDKVREDVSRPGLSLESFLRNAPESAADQIRVPKVVADA